MYRFPSQQVRFNAHPPPHQKRWIAIQGNRMNHSAALYEQFKMTALQNICELRIKTPDKFMQYALNTNKIHHGLLECNNYSCSPYSNFFFEEGEQMKIILYSMLGWTQVGCDFSQVCSLARKQPEYEGRQQYCFFLSKHWD